jgi:hypothetical protein
MSDINTAASPLGSAVFSLEELRGRVRAATGLDQYIDGRLARMVGWTFQKMNGDRYPYWRKPGVTAYYMRSPGPPPYTSSVDEALALVAQLLPGTLQASGCMEHGPFCRLIVPVNTKDYIGSIEAYSEAPATQPLAILDALLSALISQGREASGKNQSLQGE